METAVTYFIGFKIHETSLFVFTSQLSGFCLASSQETPGVIIGFLDGNHTLYATVADALDTLATGIDTSRFVET